MIIPVLFHSTFCISKHLSGGSRGGARGAPSLFLDQTDVRRAEKYFLGDHPLPPPPPYLRIWMTSTFLAVYWFTYLFTFLFVCLTRRRQRCWPECRPCKKAARWIWNIRKKMWQFAPKYIIYNWSIDWLTDWQTDWMIVWLITYLFPFVKRKMGERMDTNKQWRRRGQKFYTR